MKDEIKDSCNWSGNYSYSAVRRHYPETVAQVQELVTRCHKIKALGTRHSFNGIADSTEDQVSLARLDQIEPVDLAHQTVTVGAGVKYGQLGRALDCQGYALPNMASLPHISVAGACATATHGSGVKNSNLAAVVSGLEMVTGNGDVMVCSREKDGELFQGMVVGLGSLGVVTKLTLDLIPAFTMRQDVYENLSFAPLLDDENHFETIVSSAYSVSLFTDWRSKKFSQVWLKRRVMEDAAFDPEPLWFGATLATVPLHPLPDHSAESCTAQMGLHGPWHERLPHFRMDFTPSSGEELQSEYLLPRQHACAALRALKKISEHIAPLLLISEVRTVAADTLWMSTCYHQDSVAIHFTWRKEWPAVEKLLPIIEEQLAPFHARPHWGKLFTMSSSHLQSLYPKLPEFLQLQKSCDPHGKFNNAFLEKMILGENDSRRK